MKIRKLSPVECFALLFMVIFTYLLVDDWLLHPINSEKKPINLHDVKPIIDRQMTVVTVGLQGFVSEEKSYEPVSGWVSYKQRYRYTDYNVKQLLVNATDIKQNSSSIHNTKANNENVLISYCDYNIYTKALVENLDDKVIDIWVIYQERGECMK